MNSEFIKKCHYCEEEATVKHENGYWFCNKHALDIYRENDLNKFAIKLADEMRKRGIKEGSFWWVYNNIRGMKHITKGRIKIDWKHSYKNKGLWVTLREMFIFYLLT